MSCCQEYRECQRKVIENEIIHSLTLDYNTVQWNIYKLKKNLKKLDTTVQIEELIEKINSYKELMNHDDTEYSLRKLMLLVDTIIISFIL